MASDCPRDRLTSAPKEPSKPKIGRRLAEHSSETGLLLVKLMDLDLVAWKRNSKRFSKAWKQMSLSFVVWFFGSTQTGMAALIRISGVGHTY